MAAKPIRVFWSEMTRTFWATSFYKQRPGMPEGMFEITGKKYDVTQDIAAAIVKYEIEFKPIKSAKKSVKKRRKT